MKRCVALFNDGWADWEAGPVLAALREYMGWAVAIATPTGKDAESIGGVRAHADVAFANIDSDAFDLLLVIGSEQWGKREDPDVYALLRSRATTGKPIGAICLGVLAAARSGILDTRAHTGNDGDQLVQKAPAYRGKPLYESVPHAVADQGVVTARGEAPYTFAAEILRLVEPERGPAIATDFLAMARAEFG